MHTVKNMTKTNAYELPNFGKEKLDGTPMHQFKKNWILPLIVALGS